jgi:hypothetical protein
MKESEISNNKPILLSPEEYHGLSLIGKKIADFLKNHGEVIIEKEP